MFIKKILVKLRDKLFLNAVRFAVHEEVRKHQKWEEAMWEIVRKHQEWEETHINKAMWESVKLNGDNISKLFIAYDLNKRAFAPFKRCHEGKSVVIVGAGPSLNDFVPIPDAIYIGLNRAFLYEKVNFDFLFCIDFFGIKDYYEAFFSYTGDTAIVGGAKCVKFIGDAGYDCMHIHSVPLDCQIPESYIPSDKNLHRYITTSCGCFVERFSYHIDCEPIGNFTTVSLQAMQFALFTNPAKIYLVGIDCNANTAGHFTGETKYFMDEKQTAYVINKGVEDWKLCKDFASVYYPDTEIISVNPVRLKGIFKDWYQSEGNEPE